MELKLHPAPYHLVSWIFLRLLALIYLSAFASMAVQIEGLIGSNGILPIATRLAVIQEVITGHEKYWLFPTLFWFDASDPALNFVCITGMAAAFLVFFNIVTRSALLMCFILYLSLVYGGQDFMTFQWDFFLLEAGVLAIFLVSGSRIIVFLYQWLLARFMFIGGLVKLVSGDPTWANLSALFYHYETQPLPTPLAWYAHHLPDWFHGICVGGMFFIELIVPFLMFIPGRPRLFAAWATIGLQSIIILTGNYNFFNLLTILLCLFLFDDQDFGKFLPTRLIVFIQARKTSPGQLATVSAGIFASLIFITCGSYIWVQNSGQRLIEPLTTLVRTASAFSLVNYYGPFATMTTKRLEIIVEGSNDGKNWHAYAFKYKPGALTKHLGWNIPHQPRLDWQMWFAVLRPPQKNSWVVRFLYKLKEGSPAVLGLLANNPFPTHPPDYIRANLYRYTYSSPELRTRTDQIWKRDYLGLFWHIDQYDLPHF